MQKNSKKKKKKDRRKQTLIVLLVICAAIAVAIVVLILRLGEKQAESGTEKSVSRQENAETPENTADSPEKDMKQSADDLKEQETASAAPADAEENPAEGTGEASGQQTQEGTLRPVSALPEDLIESYFGYMVRPADGSVVLDKDSEAAVYPASMTKVMTALVAIEQLPDLDERLMVASEVIDPLYEEGASMAGFAAGETPTVRELLYGVLLPSGAEACITLAQRVAGSEEGFVELMNRKAEELGLAGTHFTNCTGLHDPDLFTTCRDMERLFETALQNETFARIITTPSYTCEANDFHEEPLVFHSTLFTYLDSAQLANGAVILGGKTGTTDEAGYCLVSFASYDNEVYILVTAFGPYREDGLHTNVLDAEAAYGALQ